MLRNRHRGIAVLALLLALLAAVAGCSDDAGRGCPEQEPQSPDTASSQDAQAGGRSPDRVVLLLDYSGSMYPTYPARRSGDFYYAMPEFQSLLARWLALAMPPSRECGLEVVLFNQQPFLLREGAPIRLEQEALSFAARLTGGDTHAAREIVRSIPSNPFAATGATAPKTTDIKEALRRIVDMLHGQALIWLVTDNVVDVPGPGTDSDEAKRNKEFYDYLRGEPRLRIAMAYPLHQGNAAGWMRGSSLFVYGLLLSDAPLTEGDLASIGGMQPRQTAPEPEGMLWNPGLRDLAGEYCGNPRERRGMPPGVPLRLKPLDRDVLKMELVEQQDVTESGGKKVALSCDAQAEFGDKIRCQGAVRVKNVLAHHVVTNARLQLASSALQPIDPEEGGRLPFASPVCGSQVELESWEDSNGMKGTGQPILLTPLAPGQETTLRISFLTAPVHVAVSGLKSLLQVAFTDHIRLEGRVTATMTDVRADLSIPADAYKGVYGVSALPEIFVGFNQPMLVEQGRVSMLVNNDGQALGLTLLAVIATTLLLALLAGALLKRTYYNLFINSAGVGRLAFRRFSSRPLKVKGRRIATFRCGWDTNIRLVSAPGYMTRKQGKTWFVSSSNGGDDFHVELRP